jgi:integrase
MDEIIYLQPNEIKKLVDVIDTIEDKALIVTGIETGMRVSEITEGFKIEMINWDDGTAKIYDEKKDVYRDIAIPGTAKNLLKMYLNAEKREKGSVFLFTYKTANRKLRYWIGKAGIQKFVKGKPVNFTWHKLRHTFVRLSAQAHRDPMAVAQQTGDRLSTVLRIYGTWEISAMSQHFDEKPLIKGEKA